MTARALRMADATERSDLASFVGRVVRLGSGSLVRLRVGEDGTIGVWATTPFDVLVTRVARGELQPADTTVKARELLTALAVLRAEAVDPGVGMDSAWRTPLPPGEGFGHLEDVPGAVVGELAEQGAALAREHPGPGGGPSGALLDQEVLTVHSGGEQIGVPLRCVFALSGMGFVGEGEREPIRVRATRGWLRLDARYGSVLRQRRPQVPLLLG